MTTMVCNDNILLFLHIIIVPLARVKVKRHVHNNIITHPRSNNNKKHQKYIINKIMMV